MSSANELASVVEQLLSNAKVRARMGGPPRARARPRRTAAAEVPTGAGVWARSRGLWGRA